MMVLCLVQRLLELKKNSPLKWDLSIFRFNYYCFQLIMTMITCKCGCQNGTLCVKYQHLSFNYKTNGTRGPEGLEALT